MNFKKTRFVIILVFLLLVAVFYSQKNHERVDPSNFYFLIDLYRGSPALFDQDGKVIHEWPKRSNGWWDAVQLQDNGSLLVAHKNRAILNVAPSGEILSKKRGNYHHDFARTDEGIIYLMRTHKSSMPRYFPEGRKFRLDYLREENAQGELLWEWHFRDHAESIFSKYPNLIGPQKADFGRPAQGDDLGHANSVFVIPENPINRDSRFKKGNIVMNFFYFGLMVVIDKESKEIVWTWGPEQMEGAHMPSLQSDGTILLLDNGTERGYSRILLINPINDEIVWEYGSGISERFYCPSRGSVVSAGAGQLMVFSPWEGRAFILSRKKNILWQYEFSTITKVLHSEKFNRYAAEKRWKNKKMTKFKIMKSYRKLNNRVGHRLHWFSKEQIDPVLAAIKKMGK